MSEDDLKTKECSYCKGTMILKKDYLPDDPDLKEIKTFYICVNCGKYEIVEE